MHGLKLNNLTKKFAGVRALDDVSLEFQPGMITGLVGPNGSGKSTLINVLTGVLPFDSGAVALGGMALRAIKPFNVAVYGLTRTFQEVRLFNQMNVKDNILLALTERGVFAGIFETHQEWHAIRAKEILEEVELWEKKGELAGELSYGQRKLLEIARVLAMDSSMIFFDEPFAGLSPHMVSVVEKILLRLKKAGKTVVIVEHNLKLIRELCDHVIVLDSGKLLAEGKPEDVFALQRVAEAYVGK